MDEVRITLPKGRFDKLNSFYKQAYGYNLHTQLFTYVLSEYDRIRDMIDDGNVVCSEEDKFPRASIVKRGSNSWDLIVKYSDGTTKQLTHEDYDVLVKAYLEWSKYDFAPNKRGRVAEKITGNYENIGRNHGNYSVQIRKNGKQYVFGTYSNLDDALAVRDFMETVDWDAHYTFTNLKKDGFISDTRLYSDYMLELAGV